MVLCEPGDRKLLGQMFCGIPREVFPMRLWILTKYFSETMGSVGLNGHLNDLKNGNRSSPFCLACKQQNKWSGRSDSQAR